MESPQKKEEAILANPESVDRCLQFKSLLELSLSQLSEITIFPTNISVQKKVAQKEEEQENMR